MKMGPLVCATLLASCSTVQAVYHASKELQHAHQTPFQKWRDLPQRIVPDDFSGGLLSKEGSKSLKAVQGKIECGTCKAMAYAARSFFKTFEPTIVEGGQLLCESFISLFGYKAGACPGIIEDEWAGSILPLITDGLLDQMNLCTYILNVCDTDQWTEIDLDQWITDLLKTKPAAALTNDFVNNQYKSITPKDKKDLLKIALVSDFHMDWDYTPGMNSDCDMPVCCRSESGLPASPDKAAGKWGDYQCDIPQRTLSNLFSHLSKDVKPNAVFWGGDSIPHNLQSLNIESNVEVLKNTTQLVADGLKGMNIFPTMGNHDTYPQDQIRVGSKGLEPALKEWMPSWTQFLDDDESKKTWLEFGYFAKQLTNKTRVISLNSNLCYSLNFQSWTTFTDPGNQMDWLIEQLSEIEKQNGYAIILAHVPNLDECTRQYARRYHAISERFQHIIRFGMFSHVHSELYQIMRGVQDGKEIGMNFVVGSVTTYQGKPPSYDLIYLDPETMLPVELETYAFDLETANKNDTTNWNLYLDYRRDYGMTDLSPASFLNLSNMIKTDAKVCQQYMVNSRVGGDPQAEQVACTKEQQLDMYCQTCSSDSDEIFKCRDGKHSPHMIDGQKWLIAVVDAINHGWYKPATPKTFPQN